MCIHGIFSGNALEKLKVSPIDVFVITNTISLSEKQIESGKINIIDVSPIFGEAIRRSINNESISFLFRHAVKSRRENP